LKCGIRNVECGITNQSIIVSTLKTEPFVLSLWKHERRSDSPFDRLRVNGDSIPHSAFSIQLFHYKILLRPEPSWKPHDLPYLVSHEKSRGRAARHIVGEMFVLFLTVSDGKLDVIPRPG
jgi:hypothetical protein